MYNIILVGTHHSDLGKSNADELYKIIESIGPEVIFVELSPDLFDRVYIRNQLAEETPEVKSTKKYSLNHKTKIIPVDIEPDQNLSVRDIESMFATFRRYNVYKKLEDEQYKMAEEGGYTFLNSKRNIELVEEKKITERNLIEFIMNKNQLFRIWNLFYEEQENREKEMLNNIYNYSKQNHYKNAIFTIGSGHKKSLIQKIHEYEKKEELKLNWVFWSE